MRNARRARFLKLPPQCRRSPLRSRRFCPYADTATASRRLEQRVMSAVPILIVCYMELTSPGYFDVLYSNVLGRVIMTGCLLVYLVSLAAAERILDIQV